MPPANKNVIACSCEGTMPLDEAALGRGCGGKLYLSNQLCRNELNLFKSVVSEGLPTTVSCTQEIRTFAEAAAELGSTDCVSYANIRETAGWSKDAAGAGPKMAALLAAAAEVRPSFSMVSFASRGVALVYGIDGSAVSAAHRVADHLDITLVLATAGDIAPPRANEFPILKGTITGAKGHLGAFEVRIDDCANADPSSRSRMQFGQGRSRGISNCDIIIDLSGGVPLFPMHELRDGYLRADPRDQLAVERVLFTASHLVGNFDKPRFIDFHDALCAHSRSHVVGCTRCLEVCPTGAISPAGEHVAIDPYICAGCGSCSAVCPTGAATYALPPSDALMRRLRALLRAYRASGGSDAIVLFHDGDHGEPLIDALARYDDGLAANILPVRVNEVSQVGLESLAAIFAYGAAGARFLVRAKPKHDISALRRTVALSNAIVDALGYGSKSGASVVAMIETDDPDTLASALAHPPLGTPAQPPATFMPQGDKRGVLQFSFKELHVAAPRPIDVVPLGAGAPFGGLDIDVEGCTLCLSGVSACPTHALADNPERPMLRFTESCVCNAVYAQRLAQRT